MTRIQVMAETLSLAHIKAHLSEVVDRVEHQHDRVVLTRNGRAAAILVSPEDLKTLEDMLDLLSNPHALKEINEAREEIAEGRVVDAGALRAKYLAR
jgi:antitoxin YefM